MEVELGSEDFNYSGIDVDEEVDELNWSVDSVSSSVENSIVANVVDVRDVLRTYQSLSSVTNGIQAEGALTSIIEYCIEGNREPPPQSIFLQEVPIEEFQPYVSKVKGLLRTVEEQEEEDGAKSVRSTRLERLFSSLPQEFADDEFNMETFFKFD
jgi:hypothetical protein